VFWRLSARLLCTKHFNLLILGIPTVSFQSKLYFQNNNKKRKTVQGNTGPRIPRIGSTKQWNQHSVVQRLFSYGVRVNMYTLVRVNMYTLRSPSGYAVAAIRRLLQIIYLFCKRVL